MTKKENKSDFEKDLDEIGDDISGVFEGLGDSLGALFGKEDKTRGTVNGLLKLSSSAIKLTWGVGSLAVKNTPKAIVAVAEVRRGISETIAETYEEIQKEELDDKFTKKMELIKLKQKTQSPVLGYIQDDRDFTEEEKEAIKSGISLGSSKKKEVK